MLHAAPNGEWMDDDYITWWSPDRIKNISEECGSEPPSGHWHPAIEGVRDHYLVFADYLVWCHAYAICCSDGPNRGKIALIGGEPDEFIADDFTTFVEMPAENTVDPGAGGGRPTS